MVSRVKISVASARGVADRWRETYRDKTTGKWGTTVSGDSEKVYKALCKLGHKPDIEQVAGIIGNKTWSFLTCSGCNEYITRGADFGSDYSDNQVLLCEPCLKDGLAAMQTP